MTFEDYIRFIKHMTIEEYNQLSFETKMNLEYEYIFAYSL